MNDDPVAEYARVRENLAALAHDGIWSHWMKYMFSKCVENPDGSLTIPYDLAFRWWKQAYTLYKDLPEDMKPSDREQADKMLEVLTS